MAVWSELNRSKLTHDIRIDTEYYKKSFLVFDNILSECTLQSLGRLCKVTDGEHGSVKFIEKGVKYLTAENVKNGYVEIDNIRYVDKFVDTRNARARVEEGDTLISIKGTLGQIAYCESWLKPANMNRDVAIIKPFHSSINKAFLSVFLLSKYGLYQLAREGSGGVQQMITLGRLREIKIPIICESIQKDIANLFLKALDLKQLSQSLYTQAQELLERELGLDKLVFDKPISYEANFSEVVGNNRADADYYQVKYKKLDSTLSRFTVKKICQLSEPLETGIYSSSYSDQGEYYIRGVDIKNGYISNDSLFQTNCLIPSYKTTVIENDILVTRVGSIGVCGIVESDFKGSFYSDNLIRIRLLKSATSDINPSFVNLLLNTTVGQMQMIRFSRGSVQQRLNQTQLAEVPIPIIDKTIQNEIHELLVKHRKAQKESRQLLEQAKQRVEDLIEQAVQE